MPPAIRLRHVAPSSEHAPVLYPPIRRPFSRTRCRQSLVGSDRRRPGRPEAAAGHSCVFRLRQSTLRTPVRADSAPEASSPSIEPTASPPMDRTPAPVADVTCELCPAWYRASYTNKPTPPHGIAAPGARTGVASRLQPSRRCRQRHQRRRASSASLLRRPLGALRYRPTSA